MSSVHAEYYRTTPVSQAPTPPPPRSTPSPPRDLVKSEKTVQRVTSSTTLNARSNIDRQTDVMAALKLMRIIDVNTRLRADLARDRVYASNACLAIVRHTQTTKDHCIPQMWGYFEDDDEEEEDDNEYDGGGSSKKSAAGCCTIM